MNEWILCNEFSHSSHAADDLIRYCEKSPVIGSATRFIDMSSPSTTEKTVLATRHLYLVYLREEHKRRHCHRSASAIPGCDRKAVGAAPVHKSRRPIERPKFFCLPEDM
jgi:hypothetical protein